MENELENDDFNPIARRGFERLRPARHPRADGHSHQGPESAGRRTRRPRTGKQPGRYIDDKTVIILLTNQEAVALHLTADAIAEKLFEYGKNNAFAVRY